MIKKNIKKPCPGLKRTVKKEKTAIERT